MRSSFTFGYFAGIPLKVHINWFLVAALVSWSLAAGYFPQEYPGWGRITYWVVGLVTSLLFFTSVLLHELGHSMIALQEKVPVNSITLFIFGGVAHIGHEPETPRAEFRIVFAGPLTSLLLAAIFGLISQVSSLGPQITGGALYLARINVILALFNLIPGFPLDGGRILRAILWHFNHDFQKATRWAANTGLTIALLFVAGGVVAMLTGNLISGLWIGFIGWYLSIAAQEGYRQSVPERYAEREEAYPTGARTASQVSPQVLAGLGEKTIPARRLLQPASSAKGSLLPVSVPVHDEKLPFIHGGRPQAGSHTGPRADVK